MATPTIFLKLSFDKTVLPGEATVAGYETQIVVDSFGWGASATHKPAANEKMDSEWRPQSVTLSKVFDRSSPALYEKMKDRREFDTATITVVDFNLVNNKPVPMMVMELLKGHVESISTKASDSGKAMKVGESLTLSFKGGKLSYFPAAAQGGRSEATVFPLPSKDSAKG